MIGNWFREIVASLVLGVLIFASAPLQFGDERRLPTAMTSGELGARVLSPTFVEGMLLQGPRRSFEFPAKRTSGGSEPRIASLSSLFLWAAVLLTGMAAIFLPSSPHADNPRAPVGSRPPAIARVLDKLARA